MPLGGMLHFCSGPGDFLLVSCRGKEGVGGIYLTLRFPMWECVGELARGETCLVTYEERGIMNTSW